MNRLYGEQKKIMIRRIVLFLVFALALTILLISSVCLPAVRDNKDSGSILYTAIAKAAMLMPALAVVITRFLTKEGFANHHLRFRLNRHTAKYYLLAWFFPAVLIVAGAALYFGIFPDLFDWDMSYYMNNVTESGTVVTVEALRKTFISQTIAGVILGPVLNCITCFGEEWGWRGYLLPKLRRLMPTIPAVLLTGVVWGLWQIPSIVAGFTYGKEYEGYPFCGIFMMLLFCIASGMFLSFVSVFADSCIPAIIAHAAFTATASFAIHFAKNGGTPLFGPSITGIYAMIPTIVTAVILIIIFGRNNACIKDSLCDTINRDIV
ncbi:MAG: CPBP family intramembrane metalloprotease [Lachnospiraceae bacterium]|nr:CPBP family intramembrane metalloprotease [Lachnospiraceae bacterium]